MAAALEEREAVLKEAQQVAANMGEAGGKQRRLADAYVKVACAAPATFYILYVQIIEIVHQEGDLSPDPNPHQIMEMVAKKGTAWLQKEMTRIKRLSQRRTPQPGF